ncbi:hypothetical protein C8R43DRAFT_455550 [Mycena crocata]|nr:hypothetical protein C8R43DRAFT_455550 [Mycena crocata]
MEFPAEVVEHIIDRCQHLPTLSSCSLVCKAWHKRARFCMFSGPVTVVGVPDIEAFVSTLQHPLCSLHPYIHSLSIRHSSLNPSLLNPVIPALVPLSNLTHLELAAHNALFSDESRALFHSNFKSIRHLLLHITFATCADAVDLVCSFPVLETLGLYARWIGSTVPPSLSLPTSLHTLDLDGFLDDTLGWLLSCPTTPAITSIQLREVARREFNFVFQYVERVAGTLQTFKLSFIDTNAELEFLAFNFGPIQVPELRFLEITSCDGGQDAAMVVHLLWQIQSPRLEEICFTNLVSVNRFGLAWAQLEDRLSRAYVNLRKVKVTTYPHLLPAIQSNLQLLHDRDILDFVFP